VQGCCPRSTGRYADDEACLRGELRRCSSLSLPLLTNPQYSYDAGAAGELIARIRRAGETCAEHDGSLDLSQVMKPALEPGASCDLGAALLAGNPCRGTICKPEQGTLAGTCLVTPGEGEACPDKICAPGLGCKSTVTGSTCVKLPGIGDKCFDSNSLCGPGLECRLTAKTINDWESLDAEQYEFSCQEPRRNGEKTIMVEDCASGHGLSEQSLYYLTCAACSSHADCIAEAPAVFEGHSSIDPYAGYCELGVCHEGTDNRAPRSKPAGAVCFDDAECRSLFCDDLPNDKGVCGPPNLDALFCVTPG